MYPEKPNLVEPSKISNGSYAAGIVLSEEMQQTLNQTQCGAAYLKICYLPPVSVVSLFDFLSRKGPIEKYSGPVTEAQEIGWFHEELVSLHFHAQRSCKYLQ
jgi:hypothetical protein